jgi:hypothetical protein
MIKENSLNKNMSKFFIRIYYLKILIVFLIIFLNKILILNFLKKNSFPFLVVVIAANKSDMYEFEEVDEEKVKEFSKVLF